MISVVMLLLALAFFAAGARDQEPMVMAIGLVCLISAIFA